jgi:copper transport protein
MTLRRATGFAIALLLALTQAPAAWAHATLMRAEPADGAVLAVPPSELTLTFNEPVSPLVMRLIGPDGQPMMPPASADNVTVTLKPQRLQQGTHVLSWRVVSADGHPVGGSLLFSVGAASERPQDVHATGDPAVRAALWSAKLLIYVALLLGIGGVCFRAWTSTPAPPWLRPTLAVLLAAGLAAVPASVGLQGLDALALPLAGMPQGGVWAAGFGTTYGWTALMLAVAMLAAIAALSVAQAAARPLAVVALVGGGLALALSGHAASAAPQLLTRPTVFLHVVCVVIWIGALIPLIGAIRTGDTAALVKFTRLIPYPLAVLILSGSALAVVQLDRIDALWTTEYGEVLFRKLVAVVALLALGAANRFWLVPRYTRTRAAPALVASIAAEIFIALAILALVATWRFTPPPRALAIAEPIFLHVHGERAMAHIELAPVRGRGATVQMQVLDGELRPLAVKEVVLVLANPAAGIEPVPRPATGDDGVNWRIEGLRIPVGGRWRVQLEVLIGDFERLRLDEEAELPRLP